MSEAIVVLGAVALAMAGLALWLWQWGSHRRARQVSMGHLDRHLLAQAEILARAPGTERPRPKQPDAQSSGLGPLATAAAARRRSVLPGWLDGAVHPGLLGAVVAGQLALCIALGSGVSPLAGAGAFGMGALLTLFWLWLRVQRLRRQLVALLPAFIDTMVRLIAVGNSTQAAFQLAIASTQAPLRDYLERASALTRAGADLDQALAQMAQQARVEEMHLLAAILGLGVRYGGRADVLLERVAHFMRDRSQAERELVALSAETRLSAWILGLLPVVVGLAIVMLNAAYFMRMWVDPTGHKLIFGALVLQLVGVALLYRLARLS